MRERECAGHAAAEESDEQRTVQAHAAPVGLVTAHPTAEEHAEIGHDSRYMAGPHDRATVGRGHRVLQPGCGGRKPQAEFILLVQQRDRKSTRLNSSHPSISYAVFCLKKKKKNNNQIYSIVIHYTHKYPDQNIK